MLQGKRRAAQKREMAKLVESYGATGFMYTEYPHKSFWSESLGDERYRSVLSTEMASEGDSALLYVHLPYCQQLCWFCTCHVAISRNYDKVSEYLEWLLKEIDLLTQSFESNSARPRFSEVHLGGGSPTYLKEPEFDALVDRLSEFVDIDALEEFSMEVDPRAVDQERMVYYHKKGINRISFGIQDFDLNVQKAINRVQPVHLIEDLLTPEIRGLFPHGVNFDIICGLPHQTKETIKDTAEECVRLSPDRICCNYLHFAPRFAQHQEIMRDGKEGRPTELPGYFERKELFEVVLEVLTKSGNYVRTGYDHFALSTDEVARSMQSGQMHWNALGVTPGRYSNVIGVGVHSYSTIGDYYFQNVYEMEEYEAALTNGQLPIYRGHQLSKDDVIRRDVIQRIRNYFHLDFGQIEKLYDLNFASYFERELRNLEQFASDGIVETTDHTITITESGHQFTNVVCRVFDRYYDGEIMSKDLGELTVSGDLLEVASKGA